MTDAEAARLERDEILADSDELRALRPQTPAEWIREANACEADLDEYPDERVEIWCDAANAWFHAGKPDEAERCYRQAAAEGRELGFPDPQAYYASFLLEHRDAARGNELLAEIWRGRPTEPGTYHYVAETLETIEDYQRSLTWANAGLSRCYPQPFTPGVRDIVDDQDLDMLLSTRFRVRQALDQPEDTLDELSRRVRTAYRESLDAETQHNPEPTRTAVLYWPRAEFDEVLRRWPDTDTSTGARAGAGADVETGAGADAHTEHRREVERALRDSADGNTPVMTRGDVAGFVEFCTEDGRDPSLASNGADYAAWLAELGHGTDWPPGRNDLCWCGSQRKYKKCCGAPGFTAPR